MLHTILDDGRESTLSSTYSSELEFAADWLERDVRFASVFNPGVTTPFADSYAPSGGWSYMGQGINKRVLILSSPASSLRQGTDTRVPTYIDGPEFDCSPAQMTYNPTLYYRSIYFLDGNTLYKRYLVDQTTPTCNSRIQKQSCPASQKASWPTLCGASDETIATNVTQFNVDYYTSKDENPDTNLPIPNQYSDPEKLGDAESVALQLTMTQPDSAKPVTATIKIRTTKVN